MQHWHCSWDSHSRWPQWWWNTFGPYNWRIGQDPDPQARIRWWDLCLIRHLSGHTKVHVVLLECLEKSKDSWHSPKSQFMQGRTKIRGPTREECTTVQHVEKAHDNGKLHYLLQNRHLQWHQPQSLPDSILLSIPIILTFKDVLTRNHILLKTTYSRNRFFCLTFKYASLWQLLGNTTKPNQLLIITYDSNSNLLELRQIWTVKSPNGCSTNHRWCKHHWPHHKRNCWNDTTVPGHVDFNGNSGSLVLVVLHLHTSKSAVSNALRANMARPLDAILKLAIIGELCNFKVMNFIWKKEIICL